MINTYQQGKEAEYLVIDEFDKLGYEVSFDNSWYDLKIVKGNIKHYIEIKSTNLILNNGLNCNTIMGRFDFTEIKNRRLQRKHNVTLCFVVIIKDSFQILGFSSSKTINAERYVTLKDLICNHKLKNVESYSRFLERKYNGKN